jgi:hypothetical protein
MTCGKTAATPWMAVVIVDTGHLVGSSPGCLNGCSSRRFLHHYFPPKNLILAAIVGEPHAMRVSFSLGVHGGGLKYFKEHASSYKRPK